MQKTSITWETGSREDRRLEELVVSPSENSSCNDRKLKASPNLKED